MSENVDYENEVYSHLLRFFSRYYDKGDFISRRRYKADTYAVPYSGEEVVLHWANKDQYYIKSGEYFSNYSFNLNDGRRVNFKLVSADTAKDNRKDTDQNRLFALVEPHVRVRRDEDGDEYEEKIEAIIEGNDELVINFVYAPQPKGTKQTNLVKEALEVLLNKPEISKNWQALLERRPIESNPARTLLEKQLIDYTEKNNADYFIHKDLGGFLRRELDFYIKNEVMNLDDIQHISTFKGIEKNLKMIQCLRLISGHLIDFMAQLENFQKKLWLKKKFVVETNYCMTLDRIPEEFYDEICKNEAQLEEWVKLFAIDEIKKDLNQPGFSRPLKKAFLKANDKLVLDTKFFSKSFKYRLLSSIDNLDDQCDGLLIHSENFQALNLLRERYCEQIKCIYIDPPYNAKSSEILYKNTFKDSTWLSLIDNRVCLAKSLQTEDSVLIVAIDEVEQELLGRLLTLHYPIHEKSCIVVNHNPSGQQGDNFSFTHEYSYFVYPKPGRFIGEKIRENQDEWDERNFRDVTGDDSLRTAGANCFYPIFVKNGKIIGFGEVCHNDFHPEMNEKLPDDVIAVYPIDPQGIERKWRFARNTVESIQTELKAHYLSQRNVIDIKRLKKKFNFKSNWVSPSYSANNHGTQLLNNIIPKAPASYPKSLYTVKDAVSAGLHNCTDGIVLDYFAGSGTTAHAVISLNREDNGKRCYCLVEIGEYFDTVLKPRILKIIYGPYWNNGVPGGREMGISHFFKYLKLESYEDTLNNLFMSRSKPQQTALDAVDDKVKNDYLLKYMLDV
ncbi:MAG: DNA methyltransferase, partial [Pusillimonas sp.]